MIQKDKDGDNSHIWILDSGASSHMTGRKDLFYHLDESHKNTVRLGDDQQMIVHGIGSIAVQLNRGEVKLIHGVKYVPSLAISRKWIQCVIW